MKESLSDKAEEWIVRTQILLWIGVVGLILWALFMIYLLATGRI